MEPADALIRPRARHPDGPCCRLRPSPAGASCLTSVIDLHGHILPGLDDGPADLDGSLAIARAQVADGVRTVAATPHVSWDYATTAPAITAAVAGLREALVTAAIPLTVVPGAEVALTRRSSSAPTSWRASAWVAARGSCSSRPCRSTLPGSRA